MRSYRLSRTLPFQDMENNCILTKDGHRARGYEVTKQYQGALTAEKANAIREGIDKAFPLLSKGTVVHFMDLYITDPDPAPDPGPESRDWLSTHGDRHFQHRRQRFEKSYLFIIRRPGGKAPKTSFEQLIQPRLFPKDVLNGEDLEDFFTEVDQFVTALTATGLLKARLLSGEELAGTAEKTGVIEQYMMQNPVYRRPFLEDAEIRKNGLFIGRKEVLLFTLADAAQLPPTVAAHRRYEPYSTAVTDYCIGFATPLGPQLKCDHIYNLVISLDDDGPMLKKMAIRQRRLQSLAGKGRNNPVTAAELEAFQQHAAKPGKTPVRVHLNLMVWSEDPAQLTQIKNEAIRAIHATGATPHLETQCAPHIFWACIPGNAGYLPGLFYFDGFTESALAWFIPETGNPYTNPSGLRLGDRDSGVPVNVDMNNHAMEMGLISNRNKFILGGSGSGKSFFTNHLVHHYHEEGAHIVLLDIGGSYKNLCRLLNGYYFECRETATISFNPFRLAPGESLDTEKKESLKALLFALWKRSDETFRRSEYVTLSSMIEGYYRWLEVHPEEGPCFNGFYQWVKEEFKSRLAGDEVRESEFDCHNLLYVLRPYYRGGEYEYLLNANEQTDLFNQRLIIFDLDSIKDHPILFPITTIIVMELFISKMRKLKGVRKVILLEEAWKAIAKEGMSDYVKYLYKTVRKFYGEAIVVTQDIEDIISSPVVKNSIINNADCKILLDQSKFLNRFDQIQQLLGLTEADKTLVLSLNRANEAGYKYKEVFIGLGANHSRVYRVEVSPEEYLVFTTEESERVKVDEYAKRHGGIKNGISALAADIRRGTVKLLLAAVFTAFFLLAPQGRASAQILDIIDEAIKKALETADLQIQRLQTRTLWLQNTQKGLENSMAGGLLDDITGWVQQQDDLYSEYYNELWLVKDAFSSYSKVAALIEKQAQLLKDYQQATAAVKRDPHFSPGELTHILSVYSGILDAGIRNTARLGSVIQAFVTQMDDDGRLRIIDQTAADIDSNYSALRAYTQENSLLSMQRGRDEADIRTIKSLYGLP